MNIGLIYAANQRNGIGLNGGIPWHIPEDLKRFKEITMGCVVVMGRKTYESLPPNLKPLPGRTNIVLSRDQNYRPEGVKVISDFSQLFQLIDITSDLRVWVIGGTSVFQEALKYADTIQYTDVILDCEVDAYGPTIPMKEWSMVDVSGTHMSTSGIEYRYIQYAKNK